MAHSKHILLVEPDIPTRYPNLALMKLSTFHQQQGNSVQFIKGIPAAELHPQPDLIAISTLFTYYAKATIDCIRYYQTHFPHAEIQVGGIFASLMPDYIQQHTGIQPFVGYSAELDQLPPDYSLMPQFVQYTQNEALAQPFLPLYKQRLSPPMRILCRQPIGTPMPHHRWMGKRYRS